MFRLESEQIRIPDVAYISKQRYAGSAVKPGEFWELGCDLAMEVISPSNTRREMERKLSDYFGAGVGAVWLIYPKTREVVAYSAPNNSVTLGANDTLDGGTVLPGFSAPVAQLFAELDATEAWRHRGRQTLLRRPVHRRRGLKASARNPPIAARKLRNGASPITPPQYPTPKKLHLLVRRFAHPI